MERHIPRHPKLDQVPAAQAVCVDSRKSFLRNSSHITAVRTLEQSTGDGTWQPLDSGNLRGCRPPAASDRARLGARHLGKAAETGCGDGMETNGLEQSCHTAFRDRGKGPKEWQEKGPRPHVTWVGASAGGWMASLPAPPALGCSGKGLPDLLLSSLESSQPSLGKCTLLVLASFRFHSQFLDISAMTSKATCLNSDFPHQP